MITVMFSFTILQKLAYEDGIYRLRIPLNKGINTDADSYVSTFTRAVRIIVRYYLVSLTEHWFRSSLACCSHRYFSARISQGFFLPFRRKVILPFRGCVV